MNYTTSQINTKRMVFVALITALTCIAAPLSVPIPVSPVPITLTNLVLFISVCLLGWKDALLSYTVYLLIGLAGLPVFSGFSGGVGKLAGPTGGYLIGFFFLILIEGLLIQYSSHKKLATLFGMIVGMAATYAFGTAWLAVQLGTSFVAALSVGVLPYLLGDALKIAAAFVVAPLLQNRFLSISSN